jgi:hypothetical protein
MSDAARLSLRKRLLQASKEHPELGELLREAAFVVSLVDTLRAKARHWRANAVEQVRLKRRLKAHIDAHHERVRQAQRERDARFLDDLARDVDAGRIQSEDVIRFAAEQLRAQ